MSGGGEDGIDVARAADVLRTLANPSRLGIVLHLLDGERSVAQIEASMGLRQPNLSQQLAELREAGLVASRREVKSVIYRIAGPEQMRLVGAIRHGFGGPALMPDATSADHRPRARPLIGASFAVVEDAA